MKNPIRLSVVAVIVAAVLTVPYIMTDSNAIQSTQIDSPHVANFQPNGVNVRNVSPQQNPFPPMAIMTAPQRNFAQPPDRSKVQMNWERLQTNGIDGVSMYRVAVPGGWLLTTNVGNQKAGEQLVFVPDVVHSWGSQVNYPPNPYRPYPVPRTSHVLPSAPSYTPQPYNPPRNVPAPNGLTPYQPIPNVSPSPHLSPRYPRSNNTQPNSFNTISPPQSYQDSLDQPSRSERQDFTRDRRQNNRNSHDSYPPNGQKTNSQNSLTQNPRTERPTYQLPNRRRQNTDTSDYRHEEPATNLNQSQPLNSGDSMQPNNVQRVNPARSREHFEQPRSGERSPKNNRSNSRTENGHGRNSNTQLNTGQSVVEPLSRNPSPTDSFKTDAPSVSSQHPIDSLGPAKSNRDQPTVQPQSSSKLLPKSNSGKQIEELFVGGENFNVEGVLIGPQASSKKQPGVSNKGTNRNPVNAKGSKPKTGSIPRLSKGENQADNSFKKDNIPQANGLIDDEPTIEGGTKPE